MPGVGTKPRRVTAVLEPVAGKGGQGTKPP